MTYSSRLPSYILDTLGVYYMMCAFSAIFAPNLWVQLASMPLDITSSIALLFGVIGAYMAAVSLVSFAASRLPSARRPLIKILIVANVLDAFVTTRALYDAVLPIASALSFLGVIALCIGSLLLALRQA